MCGAAIALLLASIAAPARSDTESDLAAAMAEVEAAQSQAESAYEQFRTADARLNEVAAQLARRSAQLTEQRAAVAEARRAAGRAARASYAAGGMDAALVLLLSDDGAQFAAGLQSLRRVSDAVSADLAVDRRREAELRRTRAVIAEHEASAARLRADAARFRTEARSALAEARTLVEALERRRAAELVQLRRQERSAAEQQRAAAEHDLAAASAPADPADQRRQRIVAFALDQVGGRYVLGAEGPQAFDCSGLVTAAYASAGIRLPSFTGAQVRLVDPIPLSAALPGDLLFYFGREAHHVAIFLGSGRMVHAVNPRRGIAVDAISGAWYVDRFTMAGRVRAIG